MMNEHTRKAVRMFEATRVGIAEQEEFLQELRMSDYECGVYIGDFKLRIPKKTLLDFCTNRLIALKQLNNQMYNQINSR